MLAERREVGWTFSRNECQRQPRDATGLHPNQSRPQLLDTLDSAVEGDSRVNEPLSVNHLSTKAA